ncbi:type IX secretion system periplasmic lipoprotein PorW/SprE [Altibacter sp. HG106]|uniref:type IX secretion system periplasmic lipoprotein PorW/SprE n=1 Tax=Altibacter sp. HG106 TaxID=3023937 RepID=UPI002350334C|nr:hypothetical protein [Altibacter sp. HG106]MDC7995023.1 hypothetical protein [Altibacter sp. HG106]
MLKGLHQFTLLLLAALLLVGCSRKRSTFLTRNYHAVTAEYNTLYNGQNALDDGMEQRALSYRDNYWEILPIERFKQEEILRRGKPGNQNNEDPNFDRAEEKAAKAIQKHSIYVDGKEHNPQIDEAYMMLGKARYYEKRFVPALDAFNFILNRYPTSNNITQAKVWKAKSNIRLNNEEVALENLLEALEEVEDGDIEMEEDDFADVNAIVAQAYINLDTLEAALPYMKVASETVKNNELKGRYAFIKGQLYNRLGFKDSANIAFDEVIELNRKSPRIYMINAYIEKARNFDYDAGDQMAFLELLRELEENRENRPFLDRIYNQMGEYYRNTADTDSAKIYYNMSIQKFNEDRILQSVNYSTLAEMNFDAAEYKAAGAYYDSTLTFLEENTRRWRRITKKRENLDDVIKYEDIATLNDSILKFAAMSEAEQLAYFTEYTNKLRAKAIEDSLAQAKKEAEIANKEFFQKSSSKGGPNNGTFYFYSSTTVAYGKQEFKTRWGSRENEDWWRLSSKAADVKGDVVEAEKIEVATQQELFDPQFYIDQIPTDQKVIDSLTKDRDFAYYQLGSIYQVKFKENQLAADRLETLLSYNPEERLVLPSKYNLYKIYVELENEALAEKYKNDIIANHPDSRYAEILLNPETLLSTDESSPEYRYTELYKEFEAQQYQEVIDKSDDYITRFNGDAIVPKFELLKATALARQKGFKAYKEGLNYVALTYPNSEAGKEAQDIYTNVLPTLESSEFVPEEAATKWKTVYPFPVEEREKAEALATKLKEAVAQYNYYNMNVSVDYYTPETVFVVLHGLNTKGGARNVADGFSENKTFKIKDAHFQIASANYKIVQIHKNLNDYLNSDSTLEKETNPQK